MVEFITCTIGRQNNVADAASLVANVIEDRNMYSETTIA